MRGVGVIVNPGSGRGRGQGIALAEHINTYKHVDVRVLQKFEELEIALRDFAAKGIHTIVVSSGDGTVQAIQSFIGESGLFNVTPRLCLLPHGTTNMTAADIGFTRNSVAAQAAFVLEPRPKKLARRACLRVVNPADGKPKQGMFLGTGAAAEGTRRTQTTFNDMGIKGNLAAWSMFGSATLTSIFLKADVDSPFRLDKPYVIAAEVDGDTICLGKQLLVMATTLEKLVMGIKPFWGGATGPIRVTSFPYPLPNVPRWIIPAMGGGEDRTPPPGAFSKAGQKVRFLTDCEFVIDGEFFEPPENAALQVETGRVFDYVLS